MTYCLEIERKIRHRIRLQGYDYSLEGLYFITICTKDKIEYFGNIEEGNMILNDIGIYVKDCIEDISEHFENAFIDNWVIMPNHIHLIICLNRRDTTCHVRNENKNQFSKPIAGSISVIIQQFKSTIKRWCNKNNHIDFLWQGRFHDHIIRNQASYQKISEYITNNPNNWENDSCRDTTCRVRNE